MSAPRPVAEQPILTILDAIRDHLTTHDLPRVLSVSITTRGAVTLQVTHPESLAGLAAKLLTWSDTLTAVTATVWRTPTDSVQLEISGYLRGGIEVTLFGGVGTAAAEGFAADLRLDARDLVSLWVLRDLAGGAT